MKNNKNRVFVLGCGSSSMHPELMNFLKNEYVIAVSQWALLVDEFPFDFYFLNDNYRWSSEKFQSKIFDFFERDIPTWSKSLGTDAEVTNEHNFFESFKKTRTFGKHTYSAIPWSFKFDVSENDLINNKMSVDEPQKYFSHTHYNNIKIQRTGYGSVTRCAVDLAFRLRFKECFVLNLDSIPIIGTTYNEYISSVFSSSVTTESNINNKNSYRNSGFSIPTWRTRHEKYKRYGMKLRRVISADINQYEKKFCEGYNQNIDPEMVNYFTPRRFFFKTCLFEDILQGNTTPISEISVNV